MENKEKAGVFWNILGSSVYAITGMLIGVIVIGLQGEYEGGLFLLAFSTLGQQLYIVSNFGQRPVMITDTAHKHSFGDYLNFRKISFIAAVVAGFIYSLFFAGSLYIIIIWMLMIIYKALDGLADAYESEFQRQLRLDITGKSILIRTLVSISVFIAVLLLSKNLLISAVSFVLSLLLVVYIVDIKGLKKINTVNYKVYKLSLKPIFDKSKWLFLSSFLDMYVFSASKYSVSNLLGYEVNAYYSLIFIPTSIINLMANFIIRPTLTRLSILYDKNDIKEFVKLVVKIMIGIILLTALAVVAGYFLGMPILSIVLGYDIKEMLKLRFAFIILLIGGGFYAILNLLYYVLVIFEKRKEIFITYIISSIIAFLLSDRVTLKFGINGAAILYALLMCITALMFGVFCIVAILNKSKKV